jgi:DNA invertase Pin-like site-specific DNA recombinase
MNIKHTENTPQNSAKVAISYSRFSSRKQRFGQTIERQLEYTREFCTKHNLYLDLTRSIQDPALSAFKGANTDTGNLGTFIKAVRAKVIETPIVLCVENLDRITRQEATQATNLFTELLLLGVQIGLVKQDDSRIITLDLCNKNPDLLQTCINYLIRANDESKSKSSRTNYFVQSAIKEVKEGRPTKLGGYLPPWFKWNKEKGIFILDEQKADIVRRVFNLYLSGMGTTAIVKKLIKDKIPKWNDTDTRKTKWKAGGIRSMLYNKQVIGTLTLAGVEYPNYLKPIIEETDFNEVQHLLEENTTRHGKHDGRVNNLFNRHIFCQCGGPLAVHKSSSANYFYCLSSRDYACADMEYLKTDNVERWIFGILLKQSPSILLAEQDTSLAREIKQLETDLETVLKKRQKTLLLLDDETTTGDDLKPILAELKRKEQTISKSLFDCRIKHSQIRTAPANLSAFLQLITKDLKDQTIRQQLKTLVPSIIRRIEVELSKNVVRIQLSNGQWLGGEHLTDKEAEAIGV